MSRETLTTRHVKRYLLDTEFLQLMFIQDAEHRFKVVEGIPVGASLISATVHGHILQLVCEHPSLPPVKSGNTIPQGAIELEDLENQE